MKNFSKRCSLHENGNFSNKVQKSSKKWRSLQVKNVRQVIHRNSRENCTEHFLLLVNSSKKGSIAVYWWSCGELAHISLWVIMKETNERKQQWTSKLLLSEGSIYRCFILQLSKNPERCNEGKYEIVSRTWLTFLM